MNNPKWCPTRGCHRRAVPGKKHCEAHLSTARERMQKLRKRRRDEGKCLSCEEPAVSQEYYMAHLVERRGYEREKYQERRSQGLCERCDKPAVSNGILCHEHRAIRRARGY